ncbi:MAG TPA: glucosaminidase domain-containing protein [Pseudomonadales bacterium]|nr:glucosaminidase domain-containing protein [Pseudomonadales bacterium]
MNDRPSPLDTRDLRRQARLETLRIAGVFGGFALLLALLIVDRLRAQEEVEAVAVVPEVVKAPAVGPLPDLRAVTDVKEKKSRFFDYLLPIVEHRNAWVRGARSFLADARAQLAAGRPLDEAQKRRVASLGARYRVTLDGDPDVAAIDELLVRADEIPPSLVLAQAASESAWGTSRFARAANNLFGEWCFTAGCGVVPQRRPPGLTHEVEQFASVPDSVDSYFRNLNTHAAYETIRSLRAKARRAGREPLGAELAAGLGQYSERGQEYIDEIRAIIRINDLETYDQPAADEVASMR